MSRGEMGENWDGGTHTHTLILLPRGKLKAEGEIEICAKGKGVRASKIFTLKEK